MKPRLWPALLVLALALGAVAVIWSVGEASGQQRNTRTGAVVILACLLLTLWLAFLGASNTL